MTKDEALRLALEALGKLIHLAEHEGWERLDKEYEAITAIKAALEAKDEPVGWFGYDSTLGGWFETNEGDDDSIPLYKAPPKQEAKDDPVAWLKVSETLGGFGKFVEAKPNEKGAKPVYTTPPQRKPLTDEQTNKAAMKLAECMDYPWTQMPEQGKQSMRIHAKAVIEAAHGIKGEA